MVLQKMEETLDKVVMYGQAERKPKRFNVTETQAYREVYANNLRMYSFLMKKVTLLHGLIYDPSFCLISSCITIFKFAWLIKINTSRYSFVAYHMVFQ